MEINIDGEEAKTGIPPSRRELEEILRSAPAWPKLRLRLDDGAAVHWRIRKGARPYFPRVAGVRDRLAARQLQAVGLDQLSMGMSHDFEVAIEEGSTCVRIGTAIFGERKKQL